ncbi:MAG: hypothetical protein JSS63_04990 [Bacteroidetes bacterium]|nr:hypothetical protein [Bacteroidota bacterium]
MMQYKTKLEEYENHPYLKNGDFYTTKAGVKILIFNAPAYNHFVVTGVTFFAIPRMSSDYDDRPVLTFNFEVTNIYIDTKILNKDNVNTFLFGYGQYEFRKWLNSVDLTKSLEEHFKVSSNSNYNLEFNDTVLLPPVDYEDEKRLDDIAEEVILRNYSTNYNGSLIEEKYLKEKAFVPFKNFNFVYNRLKEHGYLNMSNNSLTKEGLAYSKNLIQRDSNVTAFSKTVFVAHSFSPNMIKFFKETIRPIVEEFNLSAISISGEEPSETLDVSILNQIAQSRFIISDVTEARPSVYFEAGYAHGREIRVIYTCREDHNSDSENFVAKNNKVHFDIRNRKITWWDMKNLEPFKEELRERIKQLLQKS